jgi:hypothetical protein
MNSHPFERAAENLPHIDWRLRDALGNLLERELVQDPQLHDLSLFLRKRLESMSHPFRNLARGHRHFRIAGGIGADDLFERKIRPQFIRGQRFAPMVEKHAFD